MKRILCALLAFVFALSISACGAQTQPEGNTHSNENSEPVSVDNGSSETGPQETNEPESPKIAYEIVSAKATSWVNSIGTAWVQVIIEVENTGSENLFLSDCPYDLEDASGELIATGNASACPQVIAPGEKAVMYEEATLDAPIEGEITVIPHEDIQQAKVDIVRYPVSDFKLSAGKYLGLDMIGRVENTSAEEISLVYVVANLYDVNGACIGQMFTILNSISAGDKIGFEASSLSLPKSVTIDQVASYEVFAYPYQFQF